MPKTTREQVEEVAVKHGFTLKAEKAGRFGGSAINYVFEKGPWLAFWNIRGGLSLSLRFKGEPLRHNERGFGSQKAPEVAEYVCRLILDQGKDILQTHRDHLARQIDHAQRRLMEAQAELNAFSQLVAENPLD